MAVCETVIGPPADITFFATNSIVNPGTGFPTLHPFLWDGDEMRDLGTLGGYGSAATGVNDSGQVVGGSNNHAFLYSGGGMTDLGTLPGGTFSKATGINSAGHIVGMADDGIGDTHAFFYDGTTMNDLGTLPDGFNSEALAIKR